jgi:UDP-N-acetylglucosamine 3-dehydrogenase
MKVRVGILGCGAIMRKRHFPETQAHPDAQIVALMDPVLSRAEEMAAKAPGAKAFTDHHKLLEMKDLDAVIISSPNVFHAPETIDALNAGKHVLVEKPMATTRDDAKAMIAAAKKSKKFLMVGQNQRLMAPHVRAKQILTEGTLGRPLTFRTTFKHPGPEKWSVEGTRSWFFDKSQAAMGVCGDLGVHKADLLRFLLGDEFTEVCAMIGTLDKKDASGKPIAVDDNAFAVLRMKRGVMGSMMISWTNYSASEDNSTFIFCEKGSLALGTDPEYGVIISHRDGKVDKLKVGPMASNKVQVPSGIAKMFIDGIVKNEQPPIDAHEGYKSLEVILALLESAETEKTVKIKG